MNTFTLTIKYNQVQDSSSSPLHFAYEANELSRVQQLINEGVDVNSIDKVIIV